MICVQELGEHKPRIESLLPPSGDSGWNVSANIAEELKYLLSLHILTEFPKLELGGWGPIIINHS